MTELLASVFAIGRKLLDSLERDSVITSFYVYMVLKLL